MTSLDKDVNYNGVDYSAINGFNTSATSSDTSFGVDNAEGYAFLSVNIPGITLEMVKRGELDDAKWSMFLINYQDHSMGEIIIDAGDLGEVRTVRDTVYIPELLSYAMRLKQNIGHVDSRTCRAIFGAPSASQLGCGVDVSAMWYPKNVQDPGVEFVEKDRVFSVDSISPYTPEELVPGRVRWVAGDNVSGRMYQIERVVETGTEAFIYLLEPVPFPINPLTDQLEIRPDCDKRFETCRDRWSNSLNFKGEQLIPVQDGTAAQTPGATV